MRRFIHGVSGLLAVLAATGAGVIMVAVSANVIGRALGVGGIPGVIEFSETLMVVVVFLGLAHAETTGTHVRVRLLTSRLGVRAANTLRALAMLAMLGIVVWLAYATGVRAVEAWDAGEYRIGLLRFPIWPGRIILTAGLLALVPVILLKCYDAVRAAITGAAAEAEPVEPDIDEAAKRSI